MITYKSKSNRQQIRLNQSQEIPFFYFPLLEETGLVNQGFSTRLGGVSSGDYASMNFRMSVEDPLENVDENYRRFCEAIGCSWDRAVMTQQTHTVNLRVITEDMVPENRTLLEKKPFRDVDGLITNVENVTLITSYADCVPLYFLDPVKRVIALSHSGWRGTVARMGEVTIRRMQEEFGCRPEDILACIGPSICQDCYEVGEEVVAEFCKNFPKDAAESFFSPNERGRFQLDLWKANEWIMKNAGITKEHLAVTDVCTCCNPELLFSHRYTKGRRGNLCAFLSLKPHKM